MYIRNLQVECRGISHEYRCCTVQYLLIPVGGRHVSEARLLVSNFPREFFYLFVFATNRDTQQAQSRNFVRYVILVNGGLDDICYNMCVYVIGFF